jgi:hypothetical protein
MRRWVGIILCLWLASLTGQALSAFPAGFIAIGAGGGSGSLATLTLVNNSSSVSQPIGTVTPTFGWPFLKGDIPSGTFPQFVETGQTTPDDCSTGEQTYWSDGSLKFASFMCVTKTAIAASGTLAVAVKSGGAIPCGATGTGSACTHTRTLTELYNYNLSVTIPHLAGISNSLAADEGSWLDDSGGGTPDANNYKQVVWMDGPAGKAWRIGTKVAPTQRGTWEGHLAYDHYAILTTDNTGTVGGLRWMGALRQPFYNGANAATANSFAIGPPSAVAVGPGGSGTTTFNTPFPFSSNTWSVDGSFNATTTTANNYYFGAGSNGNVVPVKFTGSLPTTSPQIDTSHVYFVEAGGTTSISFFRWYPASVTQISLQSSGGPYNIVPTGYGLMPFTRTMFATADGKYLYWQGTGSQAADTTLRVQIDQNYWVKSKVIPPFMLSIASSVPAITSLTTIYDWNPFSVGDLLTFQENTGDHRDLGPLPYDAAIDFFHPDANSEKLIREIGLSAANTPYDFKDATTDTLPNITSAASYTGLPAHTQTVNWGGQGGGGFTLPANYGPNTFSQADPSHKPQYSYWAYLRTGEMQYLDLLEEQGFSDSLGTPTTARNLNIPGTATPAIGQVSATNGQARGAAWGSRDLYIAAGICPYDPTNSGYLPLDGSQSCKYLRDIATNDTAFLAASMNPANNYFGAATTYATGAASRWSSGGPNITGCSSDAWSSEYDLSSYQGFFQQLAWNFAAALLEDANAKTMLTIGSNRFAYVASHYGAWHGYAITAAMGTFDCGSAGQWSFSLYSDDAHYGVKDENAFQGNTTWTSGNPIFNQCFFTNGYLPADGDTWLLTVSGEIGGFNQGTPYYHDATINLGGGCYSFKMGTAAGCVASSSCITPSNSGSFVEGFVYFTSVNPPASSTGLGPATFNYVIIGRAAAAWAAANGVTTTMWYNDADARTTAQRYNFATTADTLGGQPACNASNAACWQQYSLQTTFGP